MIDKETKRKYNRTYYHRHKERLNEAAKRWREENPERYKEYQRRYRESRKEAGK